MIPGITLFVTLASNQLESNIKMKVKQSTMWLKYFPYQFCFFLPENTHETVHDDHDDDGDDHGLPEDVESILNDDSNEEHEDKSEGKIT